MTPNQPGIHWIKTSLLLFVVTTGSAVMAGEEQAIRLSEPVTASSTHEVFGAPLPAGGNPLSLGTLISESEQYQGQEVLLSTRIAKVCQKKGCFFIAHEGAYSARVSFKDYEFFVPTDSGGKDVVLLGTFSRQKISQEQAEHYAADLGETASADPGQFEYSIVASAVSIPKS